MLEEELAQTLARPRYARRPAEEAEPPAVVGVRNGHRERMLTGTFGKTKIAVPRARLMCEDGKTREWKSGSLRAYQRRTKAADALIASAYLSGTNTRRVRRALRAVFAGPVGKDVVSRTWRKVKGDWEAWGKRSLAEEPIVRLILDGTVVRVRLDKEPAGFTFDLAREDFDRVVTAETMFGEATERWLFGMDVVEACTAVRGKALQRILEYPDAEKVLYFDPDTAVFGSIEPMVRIPDEASIALTPHQVDPDSDRMAIIDNEIASLQYGAFNLGFLAVRNDAEARRFAAWWASRLADWRHDRPDIGVFVDQKWANLIPCFFENAKVVRDPGYNVASWNLSQRKLAITDDGEIKVNRSLLRFYHFTKLGPIGDAMTQRYAGDNIAVYELWWWYRNRVEALADPSIPRNWWYYATYATGEPIPKRVREVYRSDASLQERFPAPFADGFRDWAAANVGA